MLFQKTDLRGITFPSLNYKTCSGMHESMISDRSNYDAENTENSIVEDSNLDQTLGDTSGVEEGKKGLNWKKYLKDEKVALDALKFQKGRKNINDDNP